MTVIKLVLLATMGFASALQKEAVSYPGAPTYDEKTNVLGVALPCPSEWAFFAPSRACYKARFRLLLMRSSSRSTSTPPLTRRKRCAEPVVRTSRPSTARRRTTSSSVSAPSSAYNIWSRSGQIRLHRGGEERRLAAHDHHWLEKPCTEERRLRLPLGGRHRGRLQEMEPQGAEQPQE